MECSTYRGRDIVIGGGVERNEKGETLCPPCRIGKKVP